jgi:hypothetical protein
MSTALIDREDIIEGGGQIAGEIFEFRSAAGV